MACAAAAVGRACGKKKNTATAQKWYASHNTRLLFISQPYVSPHACHTPLPAAAAAANVHTYTHVLWNNIHTCAMKQQQKGAQCTDTPLLVDETKIILPHPVFPPHPPP